MGTYLLIILGAFVSSSGSGMGCGPDWPLCNGMLIPILQGATLIEFSHRVVAGILGLLTALIVWQARRYRHQRPRTWRLTVVTAVLLLIQVLLGAVTVVLHLPAAVSTLHLAVSIAYFGALLLLYDDLGSGAGEDGASVRANGFRRWTGWTLAAVYGMIILGASVKHTNASLACGWLSCYGSYLPQTGPQLLQSLHRAGALVVAGLVINLWVASRRFDLGRPQRTRAGAAVVLVVVQILLGILTVRSLLSLAPAVAHMATAAALFAVLTRLYAPQLFVDKQPVKRKRAAS